MTNSYIRTLQGPLLVVAMALLSLLVPSVLVAQSVGAVNPLDQTCAQSNTISGSQICKDTGSKLFGANSFWTKLINTMIFIVGTVAVLMIVVGGMRYVLSGGDASSTKSAKDTILYSIIGVIIAIMSYAIVNFVVVKLVP